MEDYSKDFRKKNKFVFELRYRPFLKLLDKKGEMIKQFSDKIGDLCPSWQVLNSDIVFSDNLELPKFEFVIGLKRMSVLVEDISTFEYFLNNVQKLVKIFYEISEINSFSRIGCRIISLYEDVKEVSYDGYIKKIEEKFLQDPLKLGLSHTDLLVRVVHKNGFYQIGPVKRNEPWIQQNFKDLKDEKKIPKNGVGFDIDSFGTEFSVKKENELIKKMESTINLSKSIEDALIKNLGL